MLELNKIYCEGCLDTIKKMAEDNIRVNVVLTSPPYNTSYSDGKNDMYHYRYNNYDDRLTDEEYITRSVNLFKQLDNVLEKDGVILYNLSYNARKTSLWVRVLNDIITQTNFELCDTIIWKKKTALPDNASKNKLTRITEFVFVFARKSETKTYQSNKQFKYVAKGGWNVYEPIYNFVEAKNNDGKCSVNKATYSTELCDKLLDMYAHENNIIYDPFMGTGTTALSALNHKCKYIGSEIDKEQVIYSQDRIEKWVVN